MVYPWNPSLIIKAPLFHPDIPKPETLSPKILRPRRREAPTLNDFDRGAFPEAQTPGLGLCCPGAWDMDYVGSQSFTLALLF